MLTNQAHANMANHYNVLWPYFHNVSALNYNNPDMPMIQASLTPQIGTMCSDVTSLPPGDQIITNIAFQQHQQQKQHQQHQQQLQYFQQQQQQQQHQQQHQQPNIKLPPTNPDRDAYLRILGYEFATNFGSTRSLPMLNKASLDNETNNNNFTNNKEKMMSGINNLNEIPHTKANNHKSKKGSSFTIDYILSNDKSKNSEKETTDDESIDDSQSTPSIDEQPNQRSYSPRNNVHSPTTPMDINNSPATLPVLPLMHSTPNSLHSEKGRYSRRHDRFTDISHPYFQKQFDFLSQHAPPSFQLPPNQHHNSHEQQRQHHPHHPHQLHQQHLISHPTPLHHHPHQQNNSPRNTLTPSTSSDSPSTTFSSSSSESMTSPRTETKEGKMSSKAKRIRTIFTPDQLERLEAEFERQQYMVGTERFYLASSLNLTEAQVKVWFQNRRIKWRKQHLEQQQARLAQGDLYRDLDDSEDESEPERDNEATSSMMSISGLQEEDGERSNFIQHKDNSLMEDDV